METILVALIVAVAAGCLGLKFLRNFTGRGACGCGCACARRPPLHATASTDLYLKRKWMLWPLGYTAAGIGWVIRKLFVLNG